MTSGLPNDDKARIRQLDAEGKVDRAALPESEMKSYHGPGTCTFYGTANANEMLMEIMGLHMPGAAFVNPGTPLRDAMTRQAAQRALALTQGGNEFTPLAQILDERAFVNGIVGLHATGGSTNHTIHLVTIAAAAALVTDGRLSGAPGKVAAAIHVTPEALDGSGIARVREGDIICVDAVRGRLEVQGDPAEWATRHPVSADLSTSQAGVGRELFSLFRNAVGRADTGACVFAAAD